MNALSTIATFYKEGGIFMHAVLVIAVLVVAIIAERLVVIGRASALNSRKLADDLVHTVGRGDLAGARSLSTKSSAPAARAAQAMLQVDAASEEALHAAADDAATLALPELTRRLSYLGMLANSATLIGLLGTITGLITAISGVGVADAAQRSAYLAAGISEALHTTAFGLMVAIPTLMIQGWLNGRVDAIAQGVDQLSIRLANALTRTSARAAPAASYSTMAAPHSLSAVPRPAPGLRGEGR